MPKPTTRKQPTDRLRKKPQRIVTWVSLDPEAADRVTELDREVRALSARLQTEPHLQPEYESLRDELDEAKKEAKSKEVKFVAVAYGRRPWEDLMAQYQPSKQQKDDAQKKGLSLSWNPDTFPPVALKTCLRIAELDENGKEVALLELTDEEIEDINDGDDWNQGENSALLSSCLYVNQRVSRAGDLGNG